MAREAWPNALNTQRVHSQLRVYFLSMKLKGFVFVGAFPRNRNFWNSRNDVEVIDISICFLNSLEGP